MNQIYLGSVLTCRFAVLCLVLSSAGAVPVTNVPRLCKCAADNEVARNVIVDDVQLLPRTVYPCSEKTNEEIMKVFPCPTGRNSEQRGLFFFSTATPTASPTTETRSPVTLMPTALALSDEPKRAYRPKKQLPPTVAPRPTTAPTLSLPTVSPSSKPTKIPTPEPTNGRIFFTRAPSDAPVTTSPTGSPSAPLPTDTPTPFPTPVVNGDSLTDAPSAAIAIRPTRSPLPLLDADEFLAPTSDPDIFVPGGFDGDDVTNVPITDPTPSPSVLDAPTADIEERPTPPSFSVGDRVTAAPSEPPTPEPTSAPAAPSTLPTKRPFGLGGRVTAAPSEPPTSAPTRSPDAAETVPPTDDPAPIFVGGFDEAETSTPTVDPTLSPTTLVTSTPTAGPTDSPTNSPTSAPTVSETEEPTGIPTSVPTVSETEEPTIAPTNSTAQPTTVALTTSPTGAPTDLPTNNPTGVPTAAQVSQSTGTPTAIPTASSSEVPSEFPSVLPSTFPSVFPSSAVTDTWAPTMSQFPTTATAFPTLGGLRWEEFATEYTFQTNDGELFGSSLSLSDDGEIITVGAFDYADANTGFTSAGRVARYDLSGSSSEVKGGDFANLGYQVSASGDGNRLITFDSNTGVFEVYEYFAETSSLQSVDSLEIGLYPGSLDFALSGDGQWLAIVGEDFNEETFETRILVSLYEFNDQSKKLLRFGEPELFGFNESEENWSFLDVSINYDGRVLAVSLVGIQEFPGGVRVYQRSSSGLLQIGEPLVSGFLEDGFGQDVEVLYTPTNELRLAFSVPYDDMVYVYTFENEEWAVVGTPLWAGDFLDEASGSEWGFDMSFNDDGDVLVVGAPAYGDSSGIVQAFRFVDGDWWAVGPTLDGPEGSNFGEAVDCNSDCSVIAIGAPFDCEDSSTCGGNVYMFRDSSLSD